MENIKFKVYVKLDKHNSIIGVESTGFHNEQDLIDKGYVFIDEGTSWETYYHAQPNYLRNKYGKDKYDDKMLPNFKYDNDVIELTEDEKAILYPPVVPEPTFGETLLWSGSLPKGQSAKISRLKEFNKFKICASSVGDIIVSRQREEDQRFNANSSSTSDGSFFFRFANIIIDLVSETITNDGCYYTSIQNINAVPTKFENIIEVWGVA